MNLRKHSLIVGVTSAAVVTLLVVAYVTVWDLIFIGMLVSLVGVIGIVVLLVAFSVRRRAEANASPRLGSVGKGLRLIGIFLMVQLAYYPAALGVRYLELRRTHAFTDALSTRLETYKDENGAYPVALESVLRPGERLPRLLRLSGDFPIDYNNRDFYFQRGGAYGFAFYLPDGFIGFQYEYCCGEDGEWTVTD